MPAFDVTIQGKTYHVEIPDPGASPLQVVVDGQPFEVGIVGTEIEASAGQACAGPPSRRGAGAAPATPADRDSTPGRGIRRARRQRDPCAHARHDPVG